MYRCTNNSQEDLRKNSPVPSATPFNSAETAENLHEFQSSTRGFNTKGNDLNVNNGNSEGHFA